MKIIKCNLFKSIALLLTLSFIWATFTYAEALRPLARDEKRRSAETAAAQNTQNELARISVVLQLLREIAGALRDFPSTEQGYDIDNLSKALYSQDVNIAGLEIIVNSIKPTEPHVRILHLVAIELLKEVKAELRKRQAELRKQSEDIGWTELRAIGLELKAFEIKMDEERKLLVAALLYTGSEKEIALKMIIDTGGPTALQEYIDKARPTSHMGLFNDYIGAYKSIMSISTGLVDIRNLISNLERGVENNIGLDQYGRYFIGPTCATSRLLDRCANGTLNGLRIITGVEIISDQKELLDKTLQAI